MDLSIIMPYKPDNGIRDKHLKWTLERYKLMFPTAEIIVSQDTKSRAEKGHDNFNRGYWINWGVFQSTKNNLLITDIDMLFEKESIIQAIEVIKQNKYCGVIPARYMYYADLDATEKILKSTPTIELPKIDNYVKDDRTQKSNGWQLISLDNFIKASGYDERFVGWGGDDDAFLSTVTAMCEKKWCRLDYDCIHLWHEPNEDKTQLEYYKNFNNPKAWEYIRARENKEEMQKLIKNKVSMFNKKDGVL